MTRFSTAYDLYLYTLDTMPWWNPGSMTSEEAWAVTSYVLKLNETQPIGITLNSKNGSAIPIHRTVESPSGELSGSIILSGVLILAAIGLALQSRMNFSRTKIGRKPNFLHHLHPPSIPTLQSRFRYTLGAGGIAICLSLIIFITGLLEMYFYIPSPDQAAISVETLATLVPFGSLIRNMHYWSTQALVIIMTIHLMRVVLTGAYAPPRRFNYLLGLGLLILILLLDFTGYVLRWDEGIRWALVVGTNLLNTIPWLGPFIHEFVVGGNEPGAAALTRFYTWHIFGLTTITAVLLIWHIFRVRRDGGIAVPPPANRKDVSRITRFELLQREILAIVITGVVMLLLSATIPAPIDQPLSISSRAVIESEAPWFFLWVQQLLKYGDPFLFGIMIPVLIVVALGLLPYVLPNAHSHELGRWFPRGNKLAQVCMLCILFIIILFTIIGAIK